MEFTTFNTPMATLPQPVVQAPSFSTFNFDFIKTEEGHCAVPATTCRGDVSGPLEDEFAESRDSEGLVPDLDNLSLPSWQAPVMIGLGFFPKKPPITSCVDLELDLESDASSSSESSESESCSTSVPRISSDGASRPAGRVRRRSSNRCPLPKGWSDDLLNMSTKELNQFFKSQNLSQDKIAELKTCRRRIKNRTYTRDSRSRKYQYCSK